MKVTLADAIVNQILDWPDEGRRLSKEDKLWLVKTRVLSLLIVLAMVLVGTIYDFWR